MSDFKLTLPENTDLALHVPPEKVADEVRLAAAMKLYEMGRLSSGAAAVLAGIPRTVFLSKLADYGVTHSFSEDELRREAGVE